MLLQIVLNVAVVDVCKDQGQLTTINGLENEELMQL
jgi:hypothetical protein